MPVTRRAVLLGASATLAMPALARDAAPERVAVVVDAEFGHPTSTSAQAVELGARLAAAEVNAALPAGLPRLEVRTSDNGAISSIAVDNFLDAVDDPSVIAVMGGKFSPVLIELVPPAHEHGLLLLDHWGSADGIIAHGRVPSWTFRLSLADAWAAPAFVDFARRRHGARRLGVMLPAVAWGRSNHDALLRAAGPDVVGIRWYHWGERSFVARYQELRATGAEALIMVANEAEGSTMVREIAALPVSERLPIVSHWGVTGGQFVELCGGTLGRVDLSVIQTFSFVDNRRPRAMALMEELQRRLPGLAPGHVESPVGLAQAYDLVHLLGLALVRAGRADRAALRDALEDLPAFAGAVRDYAPAFTPQNHEALSPDDILFARYDEAGALLPAA